MKYEIGARIRKYREMSGFSQKELAQKIGVSNSRVSNWEQESTSRCGYSCGYRKALNVSPSELLDVRLSPEDLSEQERKVIMAYRTKPDLRKAVNILLGIE
ncbi:MAG: helix-turn-helix domain-containing protein [Ruminococcus callidus]